MTKHIVLLCFLALAAPNAAAQRETRRDPAAIEILERANRAILALGTVSFRSEYTGAFSARGRLVGDVVLRRGTGIRQPAGTTRYAARLAVTTIDPPWGHEAHPESYVLIEREDRTALIDRQGGWVKQAQGLERLSLNAATSTLVLPQYVRPDPMSVELEHSVAARHLGRAVVDGVECDLVWLRFDDSSGLGEQLLYFGAEDHLLRKAVLFSPETELAGAADGPVVSNPAVGFELVLRNLQSLEPSQVRDNLFDFDASGLRRIALDSEDYEIGEPGPSWRARLPGGGWISSRDLLGRVAVLVFWASWCPTCHGFLPEVQKIHESYGDEVRVLGINTFDRDDALGFIREYGYTFEVLLDGDRALEQFRFPGQPAVVVLDPNGTIRHRQLSAAPAAKGNPDIWNAIDASLAGTAPATPRP